MWITDSLNGCQRELEEVLLNVTALKEESSFQRWILKRWYMALLSLLCFIVLYVTENWCGRTKSEVACGQNYRKSL